MGILNCTPDSFSDGGEFKTPEQAIEYGLKLAHEGAALIDVGGESSRPGSEPVPLAVELERMLPVIEGLAVRIAIPVSVDTSKPEVMREAVRAGAGMINDVRALREPGALKAAASLGVPVVLMHMLGRPKAMQEQPVYQDVVAEVAAFLRARIDTCVAAGMHRDRILVDPGFGFGKALDHNLALLRALDQLLGLGQPVVAGLSRKRMLGTLLNEPEPKNRLVGSIAAALVAAERGAKLLRVHDVKATVQALKIYNAVTRG